MIEKGKIPMVTVSFNLRNPEGGPFARLRSPYHDLEAGDIVLISDGSHKTVQELIPILARVTGVEWIKPPHNSFYSPSCILDHIAPKQLLEDSIEIQKNTYATAAAYNRETKQRRKQELGNTIRELQKEILKLVKELETL